MCQNTGAESAATVNRAPNAKGKGAKREMNTVNFRFEPALAICFFPEAIVSFESRYFSNLFVIRCVDDWYGLFCCDLEVDFLKGKFYFLFCWFEFEIAVFLTVFH